MRSDRGFVLYGIVAFMTLIGTVMLLAANAQQARQLLDAAPEAQAHELDDAAQALRTWYARNLATIDASDGPIDVEATRGEAGVHPRHRLRVAISRRQIEGPIGYRIIALWFAPDAADESTFDEATGRFVPAAGVRHAIVSGAQIQGAAIAQTRSTLATAAALLEAHFQARMAMTGADVGVNHFVTGELETAHPGPLPRTEAYVEARSIDWVAVGIDGLPLVDAWGGPLMVSNAIDGAAVQPPFSMAIQATTPWGATLQARAVQRW